MKLETEIKQAKFKNEYERLLVNILFTNGWLNNINARFFKPFGISSQQYNILRILRGQYPKPSTINLITERMLDKMSNASRLVEKLRLKGLVERVSSDDDRRRVDITISQKGLDLLSEIDLKHHQLLVPFHHIDQEEAATLNQLLDKLRG